MSSVIAAGFLNKAFVRPRLVRKDFDERKFKLLGLGCVARLHRSVLVSSLCTSRGLTVRSATFSSRVVRVVL